jgi:tRNA-specific 2-thiouridylase
MISEDRYVSPEAGADLPERCLVVVAMSGGVDSSVAAGLLVRQGYEVIGVTMQLWPSDLPKNHESGCCSLSAVEDARRVAHQLGIAHYVVNLRDAFDRAVIRDFIDEYQEGRTPNPCVRCNKFIKFDAFLDKARSLGARYIATGHYARVYRDPSASRYRLVRSVDEKKDQTYALYPLTQDQLAHTLFPLGGLTKDRTRLAAEEMGLLTANKPDSQEICFVPDNDYASFVRSRAPGVAQSGSILNQEGEILGEHDGVVNYTVGQRRRIGVSSPVPLYVTEIRPGTREIVVGGNENLLQKKLIAEEFNWIYPAFSGPVEVEAKIRYAMKAAPAVLTALSGSEATVEFKEPQRAITPGQSVVCYQGDEVVGGGVIRRAG